MFEVGMSLKKTKTKDVVSALEILSTIQDIDLDAEYEERVRFLESDYGDVLKDVRSSFQPLH